jgi:pyruvate kinase
LSAAVARQRIRKTKVVATLGPACDAPETLQAMVRAGMNVARLNFSHGSHEEHRKRLENLRQCTAALGANVAVMLDTKGVKIRTGRLEAGPVQLASGQTFRLYTDGRTGNQTGVSVSYAGIEDEVQPGSTILLQDGAIELRVLSVERGEIASEVVRGGTLGDRKGVNLPGARLSRSILLRETREDLLFAIEHDIDYIAASFVRDGADLLEIRRFLEDHGAQIPIVAKIENEEAVRNLEEIIGLANGTMVARGDLGVEMPLVDVPLVQKQIIHATVMNGKPVITATQMRVSAVLFDGPRSDETMIAHGIRRGREVGCIEPGDVVVATAGVNRRSGSTNLIRVVTVED